MKRDEGELQGFDQHPAFVSPTIDDVETDSMMGDDDELDRAMDLDEGRSSSLTIDQVSVVVDHTGWKGNCCGGECLRVDFVRNQALVVEAAWGRCWV